VKINWKGSHHNKDIKFRGYNDMLSSITIEETTDNQETQSIYKDQSSLRVIVFYSPGLFSTK